MIGISYDNWLKACELVKEYGKTHGKYYVQIYPFFRYNNVKEISSEEFYLKYIKSGFILGDSENLKKVDNYCRKNDGSYRKRYLLTPLIYIYYIAVGIHISEKYQQKRSPEIFIKYAGDFDKNKLHYRTSYSEFVDYIVGLSGEYKYFYKLDISDYFNKIDMNILTKQISDSIKFDLKEQLIFKEFLMFCGNGNFPQTECGVTSSYLATVVYFDIIDNKLMKFLTEKKEILKFKICRYVDDLYILIDFDGRKNTSNLENDIIVKYEDLIYNLNLSINRKKSKFDRIENIFEHLISFSGFEESDSNLEIPDTYKVKLNSFLSDIATQASTSGFNFADYQELIVKHFENADLKFKENQVFYAIVYKNIDWLNGSRIANNLTKIIDNDFNILGIDPRRLVAMIVNTHDEKLISKFLNKLYIASEKREWKISYDFMAIQYLLYRNFVSVKLLSRMSQSNLNIADFINSYYKNDWRKKVLNTELLKYVDKLKHVQTSALFFKFLELVSIADKNFLQAQAYNKNYFDIITKNIEKHYNPEASMKISYKKTELKFLYVDTVGLDECNWSKISNMCDRRNNNPLCHASANVLSGNKQAGAIIVKEIESVNKILYDIIMDKL